MSQQASFGRFGQLALTTAASSCRSKSCQRRRFTTSARAIPKVPFRGNSEYFRSHAAAQRALERGGWSQPRRS